MKRLILIALAALAIAGCQASMAPGQTVDGGGYANNLQIKYVHDAAHGVGCWTYLSDSNASISCLPDSQYKVTN